MGVLQGYGREYSGDLQELPVSHGSHCPQWRESESVSHLTAVHLSPSPFPLQVEGVKVDVSLRTPWPLLEESKGSRGDLGGSESDVTPGGVADAPRRDKELRKRLSLLAVTPDDWCDQEVGPEVNGDELLEFSFTGEVPPM